jgi:hypothetical protein
LPVALVRRAGATTAQGELAMTARREWRLVLGVTALLAVGAPLAACPWCNMQGKTLTQEVDQASMVLYGKLANANEKNDTTDIVIEQVIKDDPTRAQRKTLRLSKFVDLEATTDKDRFLVFCDLFNNKVDPYRGLALKTGSKLPEYLRGAMKAKDKPIAQRLRFFFDYLDNSDLEISNDAYKEFGNADYADVKGIAKDLPAARLVKWLKDPDTPSFRVGLYAGLLGHCGTKKDAAVLRALLDDPDRRAGSGIDGILSGYTILEPKEGWKYLKAALANTKEEFMFRYAALRALRFLYDYRSDVVGKNELVAAVCALLKQEDIADLAIEDLRKWKCWDRVDEVLAVRKTDAYKLPIVKRAILRFCLQCQLNDATRKGSSAPSAAAAYVAEQKKADPEAVSEAKELLELEQSTLKPATTPAKKK